MIDINVCSDEILLKAEDIRGERSLITNAHIESGSVFNGHIGTIFGIQVFESTFDIVNESMAKFMDGLLARPYDNQSHH